jgi:nitrate reductase NapE
LIHVKKALPGGIYAAHAQRHFLQWRRRCAFRPIFDDRLIGTARERAAGSTMSDSEVAGRYMSDTSGRHDARPLHGAVPATGRRTEFLVFAIIVAFIWPVVAVGVVGGYGFLIWMAQAILGPPGPPGG